MKLPKLNIQNKNKQKIKLYNVKHYLKVVTYTVEKRKEDFIPGIWEISLKKYKVSSKNKNFN